MQNVNKSTAANYVLVVQYVTWIFEYGILVRDRNMLSRYIVY